MSRTPILTQTPALIFFDWARVPAAAAFVGALPLIVAVPMLVLAADLTQYWVHRMFHTVPLLWPFHAIHHSIEDMDWLAGSRLHLVDVIVTRGLTCVPIFVLGFSREALGIYVFIVAAQATFIHANVRWELRALRRGNAGVSSLAPRHRARRGRQDFRGAHPALGSVVRNVLSA